MAKVNTEKVEKKIERIAGKIYDKVIGQKVAKMTLEQQVEFAKKLMKLPGSSMSNVRKNLLEGLPKDFREKAEQGMTRDEIKSYYWDCEPFRKLWLDMEMQEETFDELIRGSLAGEL